MKIKMPELGLRIRRLDANGQTISDRREPAHSWTRNGWNFIFGLMTGCTGDGGVAFGAGYMSGRSVGGDIRTDGIVNRTTGTNVYGFLNSLSAGSASQPERGGLVVGSGNTAFNINDYALDAIIGSGTAAGTLWYPANSTGWTAAYDSVSNTWTATIERSFLNDSGGNVTAKEAGLQWHGLLYRSGTTRETYLLARDVLETEEVIAHSETLIINYDIVYGFGALGDDGWTRNALNWLLATTADSLSTGDNAFEDGVLSAKTTAGTIHRAASVAYMCWRGIFTLIVGSGTTAFDPDQHNLATTIANGTSAGQLAHGTVSTSINYAAKIWEATISRVFTNNSGGDVTVQEYGMIREGGRMFTQTNSNYLFLRHVPAAAETVSNTDTYTLNIKISMDFSEID